MGISWYKVENLLFARPENCNELSKIDLNRPAILHSGMEHFVFYSKLALFNSTVGKYIFYVGLEIWELLLVN